MFILPLVLTISSFTSAAVVGRVATCTTNYIPIPGWPQGLTTTVCYDTSFYKAADQGQLQSTGSTNQYQVLQQKCEALCTPDTNCKATVGTIQYAADSNLATGVCYLYNHSPAPRQCTDSSQRAVNAENKVSVCPISSTTTSSSTTKARTTSSSTSSTTKLVTTTLTTSSTTRSSTSSTIRTTTSSSTSTTSSSKNKPTTTSSSTTKSTTSSSSSTTISSTTSSIKSSSTTTTSSSAPACTNFLLQASSGDYNGQYAATGDNGIFFVAFARSATSYTLSGTQIEAASDSSFFWQADGSSLATIYIDDNDFAAAHGTSALVCTNTAGVVSCYNSQAPTSTLFLTCASSDDVLYIGDSAEGCSIVTFTAVPSC